MLLPIDACTLSRAMVDSNGSNMRVDCSDIPLQLTRRDNTCATAELVARAMTAPTWTTVM